jgi:hypothetical protein
MKHIRLANHQGDPNVLMIEFLAISESPDHSSHQLSIAVPIPKLQASGLLRSLSEIHEALLAKATLANWLAIPGTATQEARTAVLSEFEAIAEGLHKTFYSSDKYASFDESEKALYSDELREIVDHMKSYVKLLTGGK